VDGEELPRERTADHEQQRPEQDVHAQPLEARLAAADRRREEEPRRQERRRDPEYGGLDVPGPAEGVGDPVPERQPEERLPLHRVVRRQRAQEDLHAEERRDDAEILRHRLHRRRGLQLRERVGLRRPDLLLLRAEGAPPDERADAGQQQHHADDRPEDVRPGGPVVDERLVRPVVRVGDRRSRPFRRAGPARPEEEVRERLQPLRIADRHLLHGVVVAQPGEGRLAAEEGAIVRRRAGDRLGPVRGNGQRARRRIVGVLAHGLGEAGLERAALRRIERVELRSVLALRPDLEQGLGLAVQPVRGPVGCLVGAVPPDRTELLSPRRLPDLLAVEDLLLRHEEGAVLGHDPLWDRRRLPVDLPSEEPEQHEGAQERSTQNQPVSPMAVHRHCPRVPRLSVLLVADIIGPTLPAATRTRRAGRRAGRSRAAPVTRGLPVTRRAPAGRGCCSPGRCGPSGPPRARGVADRAPARSGRPPAEP